MLIEYHFAAGIDDEIRRAGAVDEPTHHGEPVMPQAKAEVRRFFGKRLADCQLLRRVVDRHRQPERQRREALGLTLGECPSAPAL